VIAEEPRSLVIDSGPVIGAMDEEDRYHSEAERGLRQLRAARAQILIPVPILFEVYKRLAYDVGPELARRGLDYIRRSLTLLYLDDDDLDRLQEIVVSMPWWHGSLEDAALAMTALTRDIPVWTFNYRDLRAFPNLQFWSPA
jgi:predicted nucleic acid-binding protein